MSGRLKNILANRKVLIPAMIVGVLALLSIDLLRVVSGSDRADSRDDYLSIDVKLARLTHTLDLFCGG